ncbi:hypothetical protein Tco_0882186 [Tanacetum coccineum]
MLPLPCSASKLVAVVLGLKRLHGFLEVTAAQVYNGNYAKALRNFDLEDMELESTNSGPTAKLPILKLGEYEMWARIKQYFQIQDYALWEVIENGDLWVSGPLHELVPGKLGSLSVALDWVLMMLPLSALLNS